ncbi:hypothetical protein AgCh_040121 [Apium graveolens]
MASYNLRLSQISGTLSALSVVSIAFEVAYFKVFVKGSVSQPIVVKAKIVSKIAERKIEEAGGVFVLTA